ASGLRYSVVPSHHAQRSFKSLRYERWLIESFQIISSNARCKRKRAAGARRQIAGKRPTSDRDIARVSRWRSAIGGGRRDPLWRRWSSVPIIDRYCDPGGSSVRFGVELEICVGRNGIW